MNVPFITTKQYIAGITYGTNCNETLGIYRAADTGYTVRTYAPIKVMPHLPARSMGRPAVRGIRSSSIELCGSKVNVIVSMRVPCELLAVHFLMNAQQYALDTIKAVHSYRAGGATAPPDNLR